MKFLDKNSTKDPFVFAAAVKKMFLVGDKARKEAMNDPAKRAEWASRSYDGRWSNLFFSVLFTAVCGGFSWFAWSNNYGFFNPIARYIVLIFSAGLAMLGVITCLWYLKMIVSGK